MHPSGLSWYKQYSTAPVPPHALPSSELLKRQINVCNGYISFQWIRSMLCCANRNVTGYSFCVYIWWDCWNRYYLWVIGSQPFLQAATSIFYDIMGMLHAPHMLFTSFNQTERDLSNWSTPTSLMYEYCIYCMYILLVSLKQIGFRFKKNGVTHRGRFWQSIQRKNIIIYRRLRQSEPPKSFL